MNDDKKLIEEQPSAEVLSDQGKEPDVTNAQEVQDSQPADTNIVKPYHESYYLLYGNQKENCLDIEGTSNLLQALGFDGGELRKARKGKETSQVYKGTEPKNPNQMLCSYCGVEISGVEYQRLPDGRLRCTACSDTLVKSEMQELCDRVRINMESFFGASIILRC